MPPTRLVVTGLYRYVRNPMYVAVLWIVVGQALLFGSRRLLAYAAVVWLTVHLWVLLYEEPGAARALRRRLRRLHRGGTALVAAPRVPGAAEARLQRSIKLRKSGTDGVGSFDSAFSTANSAMRSTAQGKWASLRLR